MNYAIIGCGLIGKKRFSALPGGARVTVVCDSQLERARALASADGQIRFTGNFQEAVRSPDVDAVIVATTNNSLADTTLEAIRAGKHVLVEKPGARNCSELDELIALAERHDVRVRVGFNHRYHPALQKARGLIDDGNLGPIMFLRARYGHGGRVGYDREWRADPKVSGGGELIDQGTHLIDLARWFLGDFETVDGHAATYFWDMPVDDNVFLNLRTNVGQTAWLHASCTEWKNLFSLEIYGRYAKLHIEGLGGSYGVERLSFYRMLPEMGPPETTIFEYPGADCSWRMEIEEFEKDIRLCRQSSPGLGDARAALDMVARIYAKSGYPL